MTDHIEPVDQRLADELGAFADAVVAGHAPPVGDDIEAAVVHAYRALNDDHYEAASAIPEEVKRQIWEDLMMPSLTAPNTRIPRYGAPPNGEIPRNRQQQVFPVEPAAQNWQAAASFALVLAMLAALVALAWQAGTGSGPDDQPPTNVAAQGLYDDDDISTYPMMPEECVPNGEIDDEVDPADRSINDWVAPEYGPAEAVPHETGLAIQETYMNYHRCENEAFEQQYPPGSTPPVGAGTPPPPLERTPAMLTYFSDRLRFDHMYGSLSAEQQAEIDTFRCMPRLDNILHNYPLPVNQPQDYAIWNLLPGFNLIDELAHVFSPSDVYLLPDGRYGAIKGTVTTAALTDPEAVTSNDFLVFIAFVEEDGRYYIDEIFTLFAPDDMSNAFPNGRNGTILMDCD